MTARIYSDYIQDILDSINEVEEFVGGMSFEEFINDRKTVNAVIRSLEVLGEAAKNSPDSLRRRSPDVAWTKMARMRDKLIHGYFGGVSFRKEPDLLARLVVENRLRE